MSESHARTIVNIDDIRGTINEFSQQFQTSFLRLLRTSHQGEGVHSNRFYQTYIADKHYSLGREGLCRVEEKDDGLYIAYIDRSPEAILRAGALKKREQAEAASKASEDDVIKAQIQRAQANRKPVPDTTPTPLPTEPGPAITFQLAAERKIPPKPTAGGPTKNLNAFKAAKRNVFQDAKKRKQPESTTGEEPPAKRA
ncbi:KIN17 [Fusarium albosuccineum]|uniref:KIN17 n=1 Tax=Fusarium albosuccineum TaxID=1237068 RepID=A0A8H4L6S1_9HYPO|nr:KIN17 [Fusarium albosuccineum]